MHVRKVSPKESTTRSLIQQLNARPPRVVFEAAKEIWQRDDPRTLRSVIRTLKHGKRPLNRTAAAYALNLMHGKEAIAALERAVQDTQEHPSVRGQAAESLAHNHRASSHEILLRNLQDRSREVRFWCAFSLAEMGELDALPTLRKLAKEDHRALKGFWSVSREANWAVRKIRNQVRSRDRRNRCLFCTKTWSRQKGNGLR
jgi:HEAT repeat protein